MQVFFFSLLIERRILELSDRYKKKDRKKKAILLKDYQSTVIKFSGYICTIQN
jgi:hypothetical protein